MSRFRWGVFGTGSVVPKFVAGLRAGTDAEVSFVASRDLRRAQRLAGEVGAARAIEGYRDAAAAGGVDAVYIATPPSEHLAHGLLCLEADIPVLIEKPFATNGADARKLADTARARGVFAMEGLWTRFLPAAQALHSHVQSGALGEIRVVSGDFGQSLLPDPLNTIFNSHLGGGALTHLAPYPLSLGQWLFGAPRQINAIGTVGDSGVDESVAFQVGYSGGVLGSYHVSVRSWAADGFRVMGDRGMANVRGSIVRSHGVEITREGPVALRAGDSSWKDHLRQSAFVHQVAQRLDRSSRGRGSREPHRYLGNGYHYETDEVAARVREGAIESGVMPLDDSISVSTTIGELREMVARNGRQEGVR